MATKRAGGEKVTSRRGESFSKDFYFVKSSHEKNKALADETHIFRVKFGEWIFHERTWQEIIHLPAWSSFFFVGWDSLCGKQKNARAVIYHHGGRSSRALWGAIDLLIEECPAWRKASGGSVDSGRKFGHIKDALNILLYNQLIF